MNPSAAEFIRLCIAAKVLQFGEFTLKSGRVSPYFFNAGLFNRGALLGQLATHYANLIIRTMPADFRPDNFMLYGPAYKGIALAAATAVQLCAHGMNIPYAFHRKETKNYGEGGDLIGAELRGNVVILDDVITAGTAVGQAVSLIRAAGAKPGAVIIALDRLEMAGADERTSAVQQTARQYGVPVHSLLNLHDLIHYLEATPAHQRHAVAVKAYRAKYGVSSQ